MTTATHHGIPLKLWNRTRREVTRLLVQVAKRQRLITYSELSAKVTTVAITPDSRALHEMLGEISRREDAAGRGMLSVLVVHKVGDKKPGRGFFELAEELGREIHNSDACWIEELKAVYDAYADA